jgi:hypothetical protein
VKNSVLPLFLLTAATFAQGQTQQVIVMDDTTILTQKDVLIGSSQNLLGAYRCINNTIGDEEITDLAVFDSTTATKPSFINLALSVNGTLVATDTMNEPSVQNKQQGFLYHFHFPSSLVVPANNGVSLILKGDVSLHLVGDAVDNSIHQFQIADPTMVTAIGVASRKLINAVAFAYGNAVRILRSNISVHSDSYGDISFSAAPTGPVVLNKITVSFFEKLRTPALISLNSILLLDVNNSNVASAGEAIAVCAGNTITWFFIKGFTISAGETVTFRVWSPYPMLAVIERPIDVAFTDGLDEAAVAGLSPSGDFPITVTGNH